VAGDFTMLAGQSGSYLRRLNANSMLDTTINPIRNLPVHSLAVQPDGKVVVGGYFWRFNGQLRNYVARLNADGTLDDNFTVGPDYLVYTVALQANGKILVGGLFDHMGNEPHKNIARLNADGTLDSAFNADADVPILSTTIQADGKILLGGSFYNIDGQSRNYIARLNADGTVDESFNTDANASVNSLAIQSDGKIMVGGGFTILGGRPRHGIGRLNNTEPPTEALSHDGSTVTWLRGGTSPEVWRTTFEFSTNGTDWIQLGRGSRITGGWQLMGVTIPENSRLRARGFVGGGQYNASSSFVETIEDSPRLSIQFSAGTVHLMCPMPPPDMALFGASSLTPPIDWEPVSSVIASNGLMHAYLQPSNQMRFFQLRSWP